MDIVNFNAMIREHGILKANQLLKNKDLILIGRQLNPKRDSSRYQNMATTISEFIAALGLDNCGVQLQETYTLGDPITFSKASGGSEIDEISAGVHIYRNNSGWLYNPLFETGSGATTPTNTEWAWNPTNPSQLKNLTYDTLQNIVINNLGNFNLLPGVTLAMHDITTDSYYLITFLVWESGAGGGAFAYERREVTNICDGCITFSDGTRLCTSPSSPTASLPASDYYVDAQFGNDGTALPNRFDLPYLTINAALAAAPAGIQALIYVRNGTYNPGTLTAKDLVDFYFEPGTLLNNVTITDGGVATVFNVYGHLRTTGFCQALLLTGGSTVTYEFDHIDTSGVSFLINPLVGTGTANVSIRGNRVTTTAGFGFGSSFRGPVNASVDIKDSFTSTSNAVFFREGFQGGYNGTFYMRCPQITTTNTNAGVFVDFTTNEAASIRIDANIMNNSPVFVNFESGVWVRAGQVVVKGDIECLQANGIVTEGALGGIGTLKYSGNVHSEIETVKLSHENVDVIIQQALITTDGLGALPYAITLGYGFPGLLGRPNTIAYFKDCRVYNFLLDSSAVNNEGVAPGYGCIPYFYNCEGGSAGALGEFVNCTTANFAGFHNVRSQKINNVNITDVFVPTGFLVDAALVIPTF